MNNQKTSAGENSDFAEHDSRQPNIQPSETETNSEENAPGRTAGKAEGSRKIVEEDLTEKED